MKQLFLISILPFALLFSSFSQDQGGIGNDDKFVVVLDAGHGGHDPGNLGNGYLEKNIALNIIDKKTDLNEPIGTQVIITLPLVVNSTN